jgi:hypothetical protein
VKGSGRDAKIWLEPEVSVADSYGFHSGELARILRVVTQNRARIIKAWNGHFANSGSF